MLQESIEKVGTGRSIVIDENNEIIAGNATIKAATNAGLSKVTVGEAQGDEVIAVRRTGLSAKQKRDLAIYDNRTAELAEWDMEQLDADHSEGLDFSSFFKKSEIDSLLEAAGEVDLEKFFETDTTEPTPLEHLILRFSPTDYARVVEALTQLSENEADETHEAVVMRLLQLDTTS